MKFEIINDKGQTAMTTTSVNCIPDKDILDSMSKAGYKFKVVTKKKILELNNN